ncbi:MULTISPECIES: hypothetical protein [Thioclava]|uniref:hypothetical protein n=1 Tax=Thioclava TaxID=285107 RepID=UPI000C390267|nr:MULTISPECIES: hypothetical protein [Thioclava]MAQ37891.1 hypothetical protein [Thioclava sp.]
MGEVNAIEAALYESVRQWVLAHLPFNKSDVALAAYVNGLDAHKLLVTYHNWQSRLISEAPRTVHASAALSANSLAAQHALALNAISADISKGNSLTKYLSRGVTISAQLPRNQAKLQKRRDLDLMLNDWGIHHLHLSKTVEADGFVTRSGPLLFAYFRENDAYLLDIAAHGNWTSEQLVKVLIAEFPNSGAFVEMRGVADLGKKPTEDERRRLRNVAINVPLVINGTAYMSTAGMVTAGTSIAATREADHVLIAISEFARIWHETPEKVRAAVKESAHSLPDTPEFVFDVIEDAGPIVVDKKSNSVFRLLPDDATKAQ